MHTDIWLVGLTCDSILTYAYPYQLITSIYIIILISVADAILNDYYVLQLLVLQLSTINREPFVYENIHVLNIHVNKFSRVPHENILTRKFIKLKLLCTYRRLSDYILATYASLFCYRNS